MRLWPLGTKELDGSSLKVASFRIHSHKNTAPRFINGSSSSTTTTLFALPTTLDNNMVTDNGAPKKFCKEEENRGVFTGEHGGPPPRVKQILNAAAAAPLKAFSFNCSYLQHSMNNQNMTINQIISAHSENLRKDMMRIMEEHHRHLCNLAVERVAKKMKLKDLQLKQKSSRNAELERFMELYKELVKMLYNRLSYTNRATTAQKASLQVAQRITKKPKRDQEAAFKNSGQVKLDCKACKLQPATMMVWPCRHVSLCAKCNAVTRFCPICHMLKTNSLKVLQDN